MNKLLKAVLHPAQAAMHMVGFTRPDLLWRRYSRLAKKSGMNKLYFVLSFDCDAPDDAKAVLDVDERLRDMGVIPVYAVPGSLLEKNEDVYGRLLSTGAEFINHGHEQHTYWNKDLGYYESCFFYHQLDPQRVEEDVEQGHRTLGKVLGIKPRGFRAPHFGTFQRPDQLAYLHSVLKRLGYSYSSSTMPFYAFMHGPFFRRFGLIEFPLTGIFSCPLQLQDSWGFYAAPDRKRTPDDFLAEANAMAHFCKERNMTGILNYYADPSHICNEPAFFEAVNVWTKIAEPAGLDQLCGL